MLGGWASFSSVEQSQPPEPLTVLRRARRGPCQSSAYTLDAVSWASGTGLAPLTNATLAVHEGSGFSIK